MEYLIFINEGPLSQGDSQALAKAAVLKYCEIRDIKVDEGSLVFRTGQKGKPFAEGIKAAQVHYSVSHTGELWVCMVGENPCGIDIQQMKPAVYKAIAKRHFTPDENTFVDKYGAEGFYRIWVHREAYVKLLGESFFSQVPTFVQGKELLIQVPAGEKSVFLQDVPVSEEIFLCFATYSLEDTAEFMLV